MPSWDGCARVSISRIAGSAARSMARRVRATSSYLPEVAWWKLSSEGVAEHRTIGAPAIWARAIARSRAE